MRTLGSAIDRAKEPEFRTINIMSNVELEQAVRLEHVSANAPLFDWLDHRAAGVLLHPTSFPGAYGIGTVGSGASDRWLAFLEAAGVRYWQVCPLGPTGYGDSPYQCFSAFAGNPYLIDVEALRDAGLLSPADLEPLRALPRDRVDFGALYATKWPVLHRAYTNFLKNPSAQPYGNFVWFKEGHREWLDAFALFAALKDYFNGQPWWEWPATFRFYPTAREAKLPDEVRARADAHAFFQYVFFGQWLELRARARRHNVELVGDAPIFVAIDSADVWEHPELFQLDQATGRPLAVAGVPPDYFSEDGQLWGNPLYDWSAHARDGYAWWIRRLRANFDLCDVVRIDHFRGFDAYWSVPADAPNARKGIWAPGPGLDLFVALRNAIPDAKLIAEDLGVLTPTVIQLREATGLPGMAILQFAWGRDSKNLYLPHNLTTNCAVYPGTHDNDTSVGWYQTATEAERDHVRRYLRVSGHDIAWDFVRTAYESVSALAIVPLQDLLGLGSEARFNLPGKAQGNWQWRYQEHQLEVLHRQGAGYLRDLAGLYGRLPATD